MIEKYISTLDTERFGFKVAKLPFNCADSIKIVEDLKKTSTKLIIVRVDANNIELINQLEINGFQFKDGQVTFSFDLHKSLPQPIDRAFTIKEYDKKFLPDIIEMTKYSFQNYGHYFADNKLDKTKCLDIYVDWSKRACDNLEIADKILVAEKNNKAIGYVAFKSFENTAEKYKAGVIGAVSPESRGLGVFQAIHIESIHLFKNEGFDRIENNVLVTNYPAMKTYIGLSYNIIRSEVTMHCWL